MSLTKEDLQAIAALLEPITYRLDKLEARMDSLETRMEKLEARMDNLETRLDNLENRMDNLEARFDNLENRVTGIEGTLSVMQKDIIYLKNTVDKNYTLLEAFYVEQKEYNTHTDDKINRFSYKLEMYGRQTLKNTLAIQQLQ